MNCVTLEVFDQIATVTINRPKALNALNTQTLTELRECFAGLEERKDVRVVILTGAGGKAFVAGADISEMVDATPAEGRAMALLAMETFNKLENMPQVTIAAVNGYALGGGCEISMSCDIRIAADNAVFGQPECGLGIIPGFGGTQRLARLIGKGRAKELIFTCDRIDAQEAYRIGLANQVVPAGELMDACRNYADKTGRRLTFEYSLVGGVNDTKEDAEELIGLAAPLGSHVNLIPVNPIKERDFVQSNHAAIAAFQKRLEKGGVNVTIRREMGRDIDGACGQLRRRHMEEQSE